MAVHTCYNCVYGYCDPEVWLRDAYFGRPLVVQCANHPWWPGRMHDVPGVACRNYRPKAVLPDGDAVRLIPLGDGFYAYVDAADYEWLNQWRLAHGQCRICGPELRTAGRSSCTARSCKPPKGMLVDHADGNKANNCRFNLRVCSHRENQRNMRKQNGAISRFKGVFYDKRYDKWYAKVSVRGQDAAPWLLRRRDRGRPGLRPRGGKLVRRVRQAELPRRMAAGASRPGPGGMGGIREEKTPEAQAEGPGPKTEDQGQAEDSGTSPVRATGHESRATALSEKAKGKSKKAKGKESKRKTQHARRPTIVARAETRGRRVAKRTTRKAWRPGAVGGRQSIRGTGHEPHKSRPMGRGADDWAAAVGWAPPTALVHASDERRGPSDGMVTAKYAKYANGRVTMQGAYHAPLLSAHVPSEKST